jgi:hypothetical protein
MSNIIYPAIIFIFILGAGMTFINETGLYAMKMPETGAQSDLDQAREVNTALVETSKESGLSVVEQITLLGQCVVGGLLAILTLGPMLASFGIPDSMIIYMLSPLGFVVVFWIIELWLGRSAE